jgi:hypothetical protein
MGKKIMKVLGVKKTAKILAEDFCKSNNIENIIIIDNLSKIIEDISLAVSMRTYLQCENINPLHIKYEIPRGLDFFEGIKKDIEYLK